MSKEKQIDSAVQIEGDVFGTRKKYAFHLEQHFFVMENAKLYYLRNLNRKDVVSLLYLDKAAQTLIEKNNINLAKEKGVLTLIEHLSKKKVKVCGEDGQRNLIS